MTAAAETELSITCTNDAGCLDRAHELLDRLWAEAPPVPAVDRVAFVTAVAELIGNVISHGGDGRSEMELRVVATPGELRAVVADDGVEPKLPADTGLPAAEALSGRGMHLITNLADLDYRRAGDHNVWSVVRRLSGSPPKSEERRA